MVPFNLMRKGGHTFLQLVSANEFFKDRSPVTFVTSSDQTSPGPPERKRSLSITGFNPTPRTQNSTWNHQWSQLVGKVLHIFPHCVISAWRKHTQLNLGIFQRCSTLLKSVQPLRWAKARWLDPILKILQNLYQPRSCHWLKVVDTRRVVANLVNLGNRWKLGPDESLSYIFKCRPYIIGNSSFSGAVLRYLPC